ncbi:hypothetical protein B0H12DRAFT_1109895 [Mycena haematopus]|nr:hypothetical protein B0H12DRAFT_1109895 [Mycena haematopus]
MPTDDAPAALIEGQGQDPEFFLDDSTQDKVTGTVTNQEALSPTAMDPGHPAEMSHSDAMKTPSTVSRGFPLSLMERKGFRTNLPTTQATSPTKLYSSFSATHFRRRG